MLLAFVSCAFALFCAFPLIAVLVEAFSGETLRFVRLARSILPGYALTTLVIMAFVGVGTAIIGTLTAWLVVAFEFPGRRFLEAALVIPLAFPAYVLAYAYTDLLDHPGAVQTFLREIMGWGPRDYWFPEIRSRGGAALMLTLVLYPYVYLLARAALILQGQLLYMTAISLGSSPASAFYRIVLPMIAPAIAGGVLLVLMETIADFGTVAHFGVQTLATGIYTAWFTLGDRTAAAQIAVGLLAIALLLLALERAKTGDASLTAQTVHPDMKRRSRLSGWRSLIAFLACSLPILFGAIIPAIMLVLLARDSEQVWLSQRYLEFLTNSLTLSAVAAGLTVMGAIILSGYARASRSRFAQFAVGFARLGYAVPGGVIAVGLFVPLAGFDNALDAWARANLGISTGLLLTGSIALLVSIYMVRFMAAALTAWRGGEATVPQNMDASARNLGANDWTVLFRIHVPLLSPAALTALLIVFVDTMKELPATLMVRPFGWDTLAVQAFRLASDERLEGAAVPSLVIVAIGLIPVIFLCRRMGIRTQ